MDGNFYSFGGSYVINEVNGTYIGEGGAGGGVHDGVICYVNIFLSKPSVVVYNIAWNKHSPKRTSKFFLKILSCEFSFK